MKERGKKRKKALYWTIAANSFKERYNNHNSSFNNIRYQHSTSLSNYIWQLKTDKTKYELHWSISGRASAYTPESKCCQLCNLEKTTILMNEGEDSLNQRNELMAKCRHRAKHLLSNVWRYCWSMGFFYSFSFDPIIVLIVIQCRKICNISKVKSRKTIL